MSVTTVSSREFNQDTGSAKRASLNGPVFITDRGKPAHVLLSIEEYRRITGVPRKISEALALREAADIDFDPPRINISLKPADLG
jgi:prevent-host-death family protein